MNENNPMTELQAIVNSSTISRAKLSLLLREMLGTPAKTEKKREKQPDCTRYVEVQRDYTCLHCGSTWSDKISLMKGESAVALRANLSCQTITANSPAIVACVTRTCKSCGDYVRAMTRSEIEWRYLSLLQTITTTVNF
jgi:hypothetical protein